MTVETENQLKKLVEITTIYLVTDSKLKAMMGEDKVTRFASGQGTPITIDQIEPKWQTIFKSFGDTWGKKRQLYRLLYDEVRLFVTSFTYLRVHKVDYINSHFKDESSLRQFSNHLAGMYLFGKKATDLIKAIELLDDPYAKKSETASRFSNTRNLIFEHNYNPDLLLGCVADPSFFEASGSTSSLRIRIHTAMESEYNIFADYYEDYYQLEMEIVNWLNTKT